MQSIKWFLVAILLLVVIFIGLWIVQDNIADTDVVLLGFPVATLPLGVWLLGMLFVGAVFGVLCSYPALFRLRRRIKRDARLIRKLDRELGNARDSKLDG